MAIAESLRGKRVFVTGHTGFKGSWNDVQDPPTTIERHVMRLPIAEFLAARPWRPQLLRHVATRRIAGCSAVSQQLGLTGAATAVREPIEH